MKQHHSSPADVSTKEVRSDPRLREEGQDDQYVVSGTADNLILYKEITCQVESQNTTFYSVKPSGE